MKYIVCGGRDYSDHDQFAKTLNKIVELGDSIVTGGARGADDLAVIWASEHQIDLVVVEADWKTHGRAAGPIRNQRMIDEHQPEVLIAFPGGRGTADMVRRAKAAGMVVIEVRKQ